MGIKKHPFFKIIVARIHNHSIFAAAKRQTCRSYLREISSAGSEHLPYKQGVTGSNPVSPTTEGMKFRFHPFFYFTNSFLELFG